MRGAIKRGSEGRNKATMPSLLRKINGKSDKIHVKGDIERERERERKRERERARERERESSFPFSSLNKPISNAIRVVT